MTYNNNQSPTITTNFTVSDIETDGDLYREAILRLLKRVLPFDIEEEFGGERTPSALNALLPLTHYSEIQSVPGNISVVVVFKSRINGFKFVFEMLSRWLVPGKRLNVPVMFTADFRLPRFGGEAYSICEMVMHVDDCAELDEIQRNLPIIDTEVRLGITSHYYARRIMEVKGLSNDEKTAQIQEYIAYLVDRLSKNLDHDVFTEMQHLLVMCRDDFKGAREVRHLSRIITVQYLFRKDLRQSIKRTPEKRHFNLKLFKSKLHVPEGEKTVLSLVIGMNILRDKEVFDEKHIMKAIQNHIPNARFIEHSFFANRHGTEQVCTMYIEVEKEGHDPFAWSEIQLLRLKLPGDLEDRIEHLMLPVFNPRNEEEIMRNILSLSNQIRYLRDIPQVFISFDEQTHVHVYFTVILVRVLKPGTLSIQKLFDGKETVLEYIHDRCKRVGALRKKYPKEATVFRVRLRKDRFLRRDSSIDLYKARQNVVTELCRVVGEFRDFNGGMISKQSELLSAVRDQLSETMNYNDLLLENFFYSLMPVIMRTVLEPEALKTLFLMLLESIEEGFFNEEKHALKIKNCENFVYVMIPMEDRYIDEELQKRVESLQLHSTSLATSRVKVYETPYVGYIYRCDNPKLQRVFSDLIRNCVESWDHQVV